MAERKRAKTSGTPASIREALKKATTEMLVLFVLRQKKMYTYEMMQEISHMSDGKIAFNSSIRPSTACKASSISRRTARSSPTTTASASTSPSPPVAKSIWTSSWRSTTPSPVPWITSCPRPTSCAASNSLFCPRAPCQIHQKMAVATSNCNSLFLSSDAFRSVVDFPVFYDIIILQFGSPSF